MSWALKISTCIFALGVLRSQTWHLPESSPGVLLGMEPFSSLFTVAPKKIVPAFSWSMWLLLQICSSVLRILLRCQLFLCLSVLGAEEILAQVYSWSCSYRMGSIEGYGKECFPWGIMGKRLLFWTLLINQFFSTFFLHTFLGRKSSFWGQLKQLGITGAQFSIEMRVSSQGRLVFLGTIHVR